MTQSELKELLHYDQETGIFTWLKSINAKYKVGEIAGHYANGYIVITINKNNYKAHRLAWLYVYGYMPTKQIDHINRVRDNNKISNLRLVTNQENQFNSSLRKDNTSGVKGVSWHEKSKKWLASIRVDKKKTYIGIYETLELAKNAIDLARKKYHKEFSN